MQKNKNKYFIYKCTNTITNKVYIGQTVQDFKKRIRDHFYDAFTGRRKDKFHIAILEFGKDVFKWEILHTTSRKDLLNKLERKYIAKYNTIQDGYNSISVKTS